eukprot:CAMPEP_0175428198 /NCGR_PEP_ID=MMETSP0095-20121207/50728_1 /TAXON_ID=311494 /ORGANISM="Alexandrium monilatum, Strain CCMP3105" /LENGTH=67 /DNA_ID=CAMNT_0016727627 /DNA_START=118 /DNA_END=318 /DNA_ORIENTATION=+
MEGPSVLRGAADGAATKACEVRSTDSKAAARQSATASRQEEERLAMTAAEGRDEQTLLCQSNLDQSG